MLACCHGDAAPLLPTTPRNIKHHQPSPCFYARGLVRAFIGKHFSGCFRGAICSFSLRFYFILWWYVESWIDCRCAGGKCAFFRFPTEICVLMRYICRGPELGSGCGLRFAPSRSECELPPIFDICKFLEFVFNRKITVRHLLISSYYVIEYYSFLRRKKFLFIWFALFVINNNNISLLCYLVIIPIFPFLTRCLFLLVSMSD